MRGIQAGQATVEWTALVLLIALVFAASGIAVSRVAGWGLGESIVHAIVCAVRGGDCDDDATSLARAYGPELARSVRTLAPNLIYEHDSAALPIDFRRCRTLECSDGSDSETAISSTSAGLPVTAFTRAIDRRAANGNLYLQYWFYYPESFSGGVGRKLGPLQHDWPGYHADDWEGVHLRIDRNGRVSGRASAHGGYKNFKNSDGWGPWTGYYRVSGGSHAGHLVQGPTGERSTPAKGLKLIPLETLSDTDLYQFAVSPPWRKAAYRNPESPSS